MELSSKINKHACTIINQVRVRISRYKIKIGVGMKDSDKERFRRQWQDLTLDGIVDLRNVILDIDSEKLSGPKSGAKFLLEKFFNTKPLIWERDERFKPGSVLTEEVLITRHQNG